MFCESLRWTPEAGWSTPIPTIPPAQVQLVLAFGPARAPEASWFTAIAARWPLARVVYVSAGGQIESGAVLDAAVAVTAIGFRKGHVRVVQAAEAGRRSGEVVGAELGAALAAHPGLTHAMVFSDGLHVNGAALTRGLGRSLPAGVTVSGGLASDGLAFEVAGVGVDGPPQEHQVAAIGFYGASIVVGTGTAGGWVPFGPERVVTEAVDAVLETLDGERALHVYQRQLATLGTEAASSALLFPLAVTAVPGTPYVVRTILGYDESSGAIRFAGDMPRGSSVRLMKSTEAQLLTGAAHAAESARAQLGEVEPGAFICVSCIGRRAVLKERTEHEVDEVTALAGAAVVTGYYSNGEIAPPPGAPGAAAELHNQTMSVTAIGERW